MSVSDMHADDDLATPASGSAAASRVLSKLPTCVALISALVYFLASEGIRNYLLMVRQTVLLLAKHLR